MSKVINQQKTPLCAALQDHVARNSLSLHMPGHKSGLAIPPALSSWGKKVWEWDLTELPGLDNLRYPAGVILEAEALAAALYGVKQTFFLTQGSTCGLMAALMAVLKPGQSVLIPRNSHVSIINGLALADAYPVYMPVETDSNGTVVGVSPETLRTCLQVNPQVAAVVLVHPSYDGISLKIAEMVDIVHEAGLPVIVDEAHGAHLHFHPQLPLSAVDCGADLVVQSAHKTLTALTSAAWLHLQGERVTESKVKASLQLLHTTSPSYLILASLDACRSQLACEGFQRLEALRKGITLFCEQMMCFKHIKVLNSPDDGHDFTKLTLRFMSNEPKKWVNNLYKEGIWPEKLEGDHVLLLTSLADEQQDWLALKKALEIIDNQLANEERYSVKQVLNPPRSVCKMSPREVFFAKKEWIKLSQAVNRVAATSVMLYPPGVPILLPGELITSEVVKWMTQYSSQAELQGLRYCADTYVHVIK